ncbi:2-phosphosulfolactate phosphatase [archaeon]
MEVRLEHCENGVRSAAQRGDVIVLVDAIRASSTITAALANGFERVLPVASIEECAAYNGKPGYVTAGERDGKKPSNLDRGNSPTGFPEGKTLVISTTNGTRCLKAAGNSQVLIGALVNCSATAAAAKQMAKKMGTGISLVTAGYRGAPAEEDDYTAVQIMKAINGEEPDAKDESVFKSSGTAHRLAGWGYAEDVLFCSQRDIYNIVPIYKNNEIVVLEID